MKLKSVVVGDWYTITTKGHSACGRCGKVLSKCLDSGVIEIQVGHFNATVYRVNSGMLSK